MCALRYGRRRFFQYFGPHDTPDQRDRPLRAPIVRCEVSHDLLTLSFSCNSCIERELVRKREFPCPICGTPVKRVTLDQRSLDAVVCAKDTSWRERIMGVYNKTETDFVSLREYNDYLEQVEDMIYAIVNEQAEAEQYKARIKEYEQAHRAEIVIRKSLRADKERSIEDQISAEKQEADRMRQEFLEEKKHREVTRRKIKQESTQVLLGERAEVSAELIVAQMQGYKNELKRRGQTTAFVSPRVREPPNGLSRDKEMTRDVYLKRQAAGNGMVVGSIEIQERNWNETVNSLFAL